MEIKIKSRLIFKVLQVLSWVIFTALCIEAGGMLVNMVTTLCIHAHGVRNFWDGADYLARVYKLDQGYFLVISIVVIIVAVLKAIIFYLIIKVFTQKKISITQPFGIELRHFISKEAFLALGIGLFTYSGNKYIIWLAAHGIATPNLQSLNLGGADVWFFMSIILFVIVQLVNSGIEIQAENDLTI